MTQVQRTLATLGAAALLAGGVGGYAYWQDKQDAAQKQAEQQSAQLLEVKPAQIDALTIVAKGETTHLAKGPDGWKITAPIQAEADETVVSGILSQLSSLRRKSVVEPHGDAAARAKFGLDKPAATVTVGWQGGGAEVDLGLVNSYSGGQYATRSGSDAILMLEGSHDSALARSTFDLRDKRVAHLDLRKVARVEVDAAPDHYTLARDGQGWKVVEPKQEKADDAVVEKVLSVLAGLKASAIADEKGDDLAKYGLDQPAATVTVTEKDGTKVSLALATAMAGAEKRGYARASTAPLIAQVPADAAQPLHESLENLEDKTVAHVDRDQVAAMTFTTAGGSKVLLQRQKLAPDAGAGARPGWAVLAPRSGQAKGWKVNSILYVFANLKADKIAAETQADLARYGLDKPTSTAVLQDVAGKTLASVKVGKADGSLVYAIADGDPRVFEVEKGRLAELPRSGDDVLEAPPGPAKN